MSLPDNPILDILISLTLIYALISVLVSILIEWWNHWQKSRAKMLHQAILQLLKDPLNLDYGFLFYSHYTISGLKSTENRPPQYISSSTFADVLIDIIAQQVKKTQVIKTEVADDLKTHTLMEENLVPAGVMEGFKKGLNDMKSSPFRELLLSFLDKSGGKYENLKPLIEKWYNDYMDRVTGWYKTAQQSKLIVFGFIVAIALNVDSLHLLKVLSLDGEFRIRLVAQAESVVNRYETDTLKSILNNEKVFFYLNNDTTTASKKRKEQLPELVSKLDSASKASYLKIDSTMWTIEQLNIPVGWSENTAPLSWEWHSCKDSNAVNKKITPSLAAYNEERNHPKNCWTVFKYILGICISGVSLSFGAPFWFDLLVKFVNIRRAGKNLRTLLLLPNHNDMTTPFTNVHAHVFDSNCAPDRFLRVIPSGFVRRFSGFFKSIFESKTGRAVIHRLATILPRGDKGMRRAIERYVAFLDIGLEKSQINIFQKTLETGLRYDSSVRIVGLTMNMDFMDSTPSVNMKSFSTQLSEVMRIKEFYPKNFFPFLGVDPRHLSGQALANWADSYFTKGFSHEGNVYPYFYGIKLYPALGFFPFDPRLTELYAYAQKNNIPIMTHCTRGGSQYIGASIESLIPHIPNFLMPNNPNSNAIVAQDSIIKRINSYYTKDWIQNSQLGNNDLACDLFGHPENYIPVFEAFPKLKICLAHLGGSDEVKPINEDKRLKEIREIDPVSWFQRICEMMSQYENLYTDISYTLSDLDKDDILNQVANKLLADTDLASRVLFGTDFFMVEREDRESALYDLAKVKLDPNVFNNLTRTNPQKYLMV